jgi:hypothetical protein
VKGEKCGFSQVRSWHSGDEIDEEHKKSHSVLQTLINIAEGTI